MGGSRLFVPCLCPMVRLLRTLRKDTWWFLGISFLAAFDFHALVFLVRFWRLFVFSYII
jgi:hypothetical protein